MTEKIKQSEGKMDKLISKKLLTNKIYECFFLKLRLDRFEPRKT